MNSTQIRRILERQQFGRSPLAVMPRGDIEVREYTMDASLLTDRIVPASAYFSLVNMMTVQGRSYPPGLDGLALFTNISL